VSAAFPRLSDGGTIVCLAPGPSLTTEDVEYVRGKAPVIAINDAIRLAPWADALHSSDSIWWQKHYREMRRFQGLKFRVSPSLQKPNGRPSKHHCPNCRRRQAPNVACWCDGIITLWNGGHRGLSLEPGVVVTTDNSGGAAINLAVILGAKTVLLVGYDMGTDDKGRSHFHEKTATMTRSPYDKFRKLIATMVEPLKAAGITVINCSRRTALDAFPTQPLREALPEPMESERVA
jgi:hypothetical protein